MRQLIYFQSDQKHFYAVLLSKELSRQEFMRLQWLLNNAEEVHKQELRGSFIGPGKEMLSPWSTNAVEICRNMGVESVERIEKLRKNDSGDLQYDVMLESLYVNPGQDIFSVDRDPEPVRYIRNLTNYNEKEALALSPEEIDYLKKIRKAKKRDWSDCEIYGFAQANSEHCRHKIFNGLFIIDDEKKEESLFALIKKTSLVNRNYIVSAYTDNVALIQGPEIEQFSPRRQDTADFFDIRKIKTAISLKAETHNFPTSVEPFYGASTGSGGEIRDRMAGGKGSIPLSGTAVYMTSYPRLHKQQTWAFAFPERKWLYQSPKEILIKASNGASDFGNKFGQPITCGSLLTFEHFENDHIYAYDKVVMLAGGVGYARSEDAQKAIPEPGDIVVLLGGDNYRIGMGGGAVSSVATGESDHNIELNAVQRANPEMQKRVANVIRALAESEVNSIVSIHDHGAGGHFNCFAELLESQGGEIHISALPLGDPTLSVKEIIGNESQERMGLIIKEQDLGLIRRIAERERAPIYEVGRVSGDMKFRMITREGKTPVDMNIKELLGKPPQSIIEDNRKDLLFDDPEYDEDILFPYLEKVLQVEAVACKDWLTNKVDRSVGGRIAMQQCCGQIQLPLNNLAISCLDYKGRKGIATAIGHAPVAALTDPETASQLSVVEALTNIIWTPLKYGLQGISLSANWMWPAKNPGENDRLYRAVKSVSDFAIALGINIPTGKDSLSMSQFYPNGTKVLSPGTLIITAVAEASDVRKKISPSLLPVENSGIIHIDFSDASFNLGGSSFAQTQNKVGRYCPKTAKPSYIKKAFACVQDMIRKDMILAGHDISSGGMITSILEMCFPQSTHGLDLHLDTISESSLIKILFSEAPGLIIQVSDIKKAEKHLQKATLQYHILGSLIEDRIVRIRKDDKDYELNINYLRDVWFNTSYYFDREQCGEKHARQRFLNYKKQELEFRFPESFTGLESSYPLRKAKGNGGVVGAAIIREKGVNGDREMAYTLYHAGFEVKDIHMTDLISGRENLEDVQMIVFVGGFSNSDVLGSAKGWAGAFLFNEKARKSLEKFYKRKDTLSLGICNGCQLMIELGFIFPEHKDKPVLRPNASGKFESAFINVDILDNQSIMLKSLQGSRLGVWIAHGEGSFYLPYKENKYHIPMKYSYGEYPGNPNASIYNTAALCSSDGRHLAMMPHPERSIFPWQWAAYPHKRNNDEISPWIEAFSNAKSWLEKKKSLK
jgi:phosphoribosylformylglycinamidine synthase